MINRRSFLKTSTLGALLPWTLQGLGAKALGQEASAFLSALSTTSETNDRVLVVIQLNGGNDGLNTVIPLDQMGRYKSIRPNVAIAEEKALKLRYHEQAGLHPALTGFQNLYNDGRLAVVENVGYMNPSFSHFQANDIWFKGANDVTSGWLGRYLQDRYPTYPTGFPNSQMPDPLAIQISAVASTALLGPKQSVAMAIQDVETFARLIGEKPSAPSSPVLNNIAKDYVNFVREQQVLSVSYADQLKAAAGKGVNSVTYPSGNRLAEQLRLVARLIHGGLQTKVYYVTLGGFDTHANQVDVNDSSTGFHANLLRQLGDAVRVFLDDLKNLKLEDRVAGMTFSEFGRRALSNGSRGTDHGWASPQFVFGGGIKTQWVGSSPKLSGLVENNVGMEYDFRQVYASLLRDWFGADEAMVRSILLGRDYEVVPIFRETTTSLEPETSPLLLYPNPATDQVTLRWPFGESLKQVGLTDISGRTLEVQSQVLSSNSIFLNVQRLPPAVYIVQVETTNARYVRQLVVR